MRKNVIALMLILPILLVFVLFSSGQVASLGVVISANGIEILQKFENDTLYLDLAKYKNDFSINAQVKPQNASNKKYTFSVGQIEGSDFADVSVKDGQIIANSPGMAKLTAISNDGGYTDSITVIIGSSKPVDVEFTLISQTGEQQNLLQSSNGLDGTINSGKYSYISKVIPNGFENAQLEVEEGFAIINENEKTILFPFSGEVKLKLTLEEALNGKLEKIIDLNVQKQQTSSNFTINGAGATVIGLEIQQTSASFYIEAAEKPEIVLSEDLVNAEIETIKENCYLAKINFNANHNSSRVNVNIVVGEEQEEIIFSFMPFDFIVKNELPVFDYDNVAITKGKPVKFYASPIVEKPGVTYKWWVNEEKQNTVNLVINEQTNICSLTANELGNFKLYVQAFYNNVEMDVFIVEININVVEQFNNVQITNKTDVGLAARTVVAGLKADDNGSISANNYEIKILAYNQGETSNDLSSFEIKVNNPSLAEINVENNAVYLTPKGAGEVVVSVAWLGNDSYNTNVKTMLTIGVDASAVEVSTSKQLFAQTKAGKAVVLAVDIMLDAENNNYEAMLGTMQSTYNTDYYKQLGIIDQAKVKFVMEFKNNVYGNGHFINAENFTNRQDASGKPLLYKGPLCFVKAGELASVAGQDNIAFLMRTNGVTLYNVKLLGCNDESLIDANGYNLSKLDNVGTTLDINASVNVINCRIQNGRNVIRVYGGNKQGDNYFVDSLNQLSTCENERINVNIKGCRISQGREFLLKIGANKALRATNEAEPDLLNENGEPYSNQTNNYLNDEYFYNHYVLTDVNLQDSVLETSGLFSVGIESNFAGMFLYNENFGDFTKGWNGTGGTSFASVLHLIGDVRLYDWKELKNVDSSTLIQSDSANPLLKLDIAQMLNCVRQQDMANFGDILLEVKENENKVYVHGGIAFYGGGKNLAQLDMSLLKENLKDLKQYNVNISVLKNAEDTNLQNQGNILPLAAGQQDFRFFLYSANSGNSLAQQNQTDALKYDGIQHFSAF